MGGTFRLEEDSTTEDMEGTKRNSQKPKHTESCWSIKEHSTATQMEWSRNSQNSQLPPHPNRRISQ